MQRVSVRFFNDKEVRAIWDDQNAKWWFSVVDIIGVLTDSKDPRKYWTVLKTRLKQRNPQLTTNCSQLKLTAADGKKYATDCLLQDDIITLVENVPSKKTAAPIKALLLPALTDRIHDREVYMKGVDYSYYYEQAEEISSFES